MTTEETVEQPCDAAAAAVAAGYSLYPIHDSLRLLDAHLIFEPLLSSLGVVPQQMVNSAGLSFPVLIKHSCLLHFEDVAFLLHKR